jgi:NADH/NAD ratio-sensing transcriptional regulator Rex
VSDEQADVPTSSAPDAQAVPPAPAKRIPEATVLRLPVYQRILAELVRAGARTVSSEQLAELARMNAAKVRKDLSLLGSFGTRGSGYDPGFLISQIDRALGVDENWSVAVVGIGNLGRALTNSAGFASRGCEVTSLLNFAPRVLNVPPAVHLRYVDLSIELQVLGFYRAREEELGRAGSNGGERGPLMRAVGLSARSDLD